MKYLLVIIVVLILCNPCHAKIYKWVDENGRLHFSDKPLHTEAEEADIDQTGITVDKPVTNKNPKIEKKSPSSIKKSKKKIKPSEHIISEKDYRISASVGELGGDIISITGRISSGPKCENMTVTAKAKSDAGLSATIVEKIRKPNSGGSVIFEGNAKAVGSSDDYGTWEIDSVKITCDD